MAPRCARSSALLPVGSMDEVFICGPDEMITATEAALVEAGVPADRIRTERFTANLPAAQRVAREAAEPRASATEVTIDRDAGRQGRT
jgi:ring-1,2-phenylacetyl-CoA epoxidase subunit PaaE